MITRKLGNTGWRVPLLSLGGQSALERTGPKATPEAIEIIHHFLALGGNYIDTSPRYSAREGNRTSEKVIGKAIVGQNRDSFYLATKTEKRKEEQAWKDINESITTLGTTPDCIQIHHLDNRDEVKQVFSKDGAMKALIRAKDQKLTKFIGITGHRDPGVLMNALKKYRFDTVLGAFNAADAHMKQMSFQRELIPHCDQNDIGFIAMKTCSRGALLSTEVAIQSMENLLHYVWSFPVTTAIVGMNNMAQLDRNMTLAKNFKKMSSYRKHKLEELTSKNARNVMYFNKNGNEKFWKFYRRGVETPMFVV
jgi:uncharacterized protein